MAGRNQKEGLDFFTVDVDFTDNRKVRRIMRTCGPISVTVLVKLMSVIYGTRGYWIERDEDLSFDIADNLGIDEGEVSRIISAAVDVNFFSKEVYEAHTVLTSYEIQARFMIASKRRIKPISVDRFKVDEDNNLISVDGNSISVDINSGNVDRNEQRKGKGRIGEDRKENTPVGADAQTKGAKINPGGSNANPVARPPSPEVVMPWDSLGFLGAWQQWKDYKKAEHKFSYKSPHSEQAALKELCEFAEGVEATALKIIEKSIAKGWKGFFPLDNVNNGKQQTTGKAADSGSGVNADYKRKLEERLANLAGQGGHSASGNPESSDAGAT